MLDLHGPGRANHVRPIPALIVLRVDGDRNPLHAKVLGNGSFSSLPGLIRHSTDFPLMTCSTVRLQDDGT